MTTLRRNDDFITWTDTGYVWRDTWDQRELRYVLQAIKESLATLTSGRAALEWDWQEPAPPRPGYVADVFVRAAGRRERVPIVGGRDVIGQVAPVFAMLEHLTAGGIRVYPRWRQGRWIALAFVTGPRTVEHATFV